MSTSLPTDSAARKRIPLARGCFDYAPAALAAAANYAISDSKYLTRSSQSQLVDAAVDRSPESQLVEAVVYRSPEAIAFHALSVAQVWLEEHRGAPRGVCGRYADRGLFVCLRLFPAALAAVARISLVGAEKHAPGQPLAHYRGLSMDHPDTILRHLVDLVEDHGAGVGLDENGEPQVAYIAWRGLVYAQELLEAQGAPVAPAAVFPEDQG